jgi:hypothetical protein
VVGGGATLPTCHYHLPVMSLPWRLGLQSGAIPAPIPYLSADVSAIAGWRARLRPLRGLRVGLVWSGDPRPDMRACALIDRRRSLRLDQFAAFAGIAGATFVSLQKGTPAQQAKVPPKGLCLVDHSDELNDFADTAALVANLDLVISVDTATAHLAGAMGKPVWILSRFDGCWRWLLDRDDTPWYPTARLFRQTVAGDWDTVIERVSAELRLVAAGASDHLLPAVSHR